MKKLLIITGLIYLFAGTGCKKGFLDINVNPNNSTEVGPELIFPAALNATASRQITAYTSMSGWMQQWSVSGSYAVSNTVAFYNYNQTTDYGEGLWDGIYNTLEDYYQVETKAQVLAKPFYIGAAKIMMAHEFQQLVDIFGSVPYMDALQGTNIIQPTYTDAQTIYEDLINQIDSGIVDIKTSGGADVPSGSDIMFGGDVTSWVQFANSLKLRILMRQTEMSGRASYIQDKINDIKNEGSGFLQTDAGVNPPYLNSAGKQNPFYGFNYNTSNTYVNDFWRANQFAIDFYFKNHDARGSKIYAPIASSISDNQNYWANNPSSNAPADTLLVWQGNVIGQQTGALVGSASSAFGPPTPSFSYGPGNSLTYTTKISSNVSQPAIIMLAAESYFLQAEAALRGWLSGKAEDLYHAGIQASFDYFGAGDATEYYSQAGKSNIYWDDSKSFDYKLNLIIAQKWAAENCVTPFEEWCDYRRLPNLSFNKQIPLTESIYAEDPKQVPYRILYPTTEYGSNGPNVPEQGDKAYRTDKIFWMP
jgi:hypothetical protein